MFRSKQNPRVKALANEPDSVSFKQAFSQLEQAVDILADEIVKSTEKNNSLKKRKKDKEHPAQIFA